MSNICFCQGMYITRNKFGLYVLNLYDMTTPYLSNFHIVYMLHVNNTVIKICKMQNLYYLVHLMLDDLSQEMCMIQAISFTEQICI